jgi:hypothetical protein
MTEMEVRMRHGLLVFVILASAVPVSAQTTLIPPPLPKSVDLSGPRIGMTALSDGLVEKLHRRSIDVRPTISQFGWQFERQFYSKTSGVAAVNEWVVLVGGLDQGVALPSVSWLVGLRTREGTEFGVGPNVTPAGVALAFAAGVTMRAGVLNVPMNVAVVPSKAGTRVSFLTGFNMRRR